MKKSGLLILFICMGILNSYAATYYVSQSLGDDNNDGLSEAAPWQTIAKLNSFTFTSGDEILFKADDTWRERLVITVKVLISSYGEGNYPRISGAEVITGWNQYSDNVYSVTLATETHMVTVDDHIRWKGTGPDTLEQGQFCWENSILYLYSEENPDTMGVMVEAAVRDNAIYCTTKLYNVLISNLALEKTNSAALNAINARYWTIRDNVMRFGYSSTTDGAGIQLTLGNNQVVENNNVSYSFGDAIIGWRTTGISIRDNVVSNVYSGINTGGDGIQVSGKYEGETDNTEILDNVVNMKSTDVGKGCIQYEKGQYTIISGNTCMYGSYGVGFESDYVTVAENICAYSGLENGYDWASGILHSGDWTMYDNVFQNNLIYNCVKGFFLLDTNYDDYRENFIFQNNTVYNCKEAFDCRSYLSGDFENNLMWGEAADDDTLFFSIRKPQTLNSNYNMIGPENTGYIQYGETGYYDTMLAYQATGNDANSLTDSPEFVSVENKDLHLTPESDAVDSGVAVDLLIDLEGEDRLQDSATNMGALETVLDYNGLVVTPSADATVRNGVYAQSNMGYTKTLFTGDSIYEDYCGSSYITFSTASFLRPVTTGTLNLYIESVTGTDVTGKLYLVDSSFAEATISAQTCPVATTQVAEWTAAADTNLEIDITTVLNQAISAGESLTLCLQAESTVDNISSVVYTSREGYCGFAPILVYDAPVVDPDELICYSLENYTLNYNNGIANGLTATDVARNNVNRSTKSTFALTSCNSNGWSDEVIDDTKYITFTVTPEPGYIMNLSKLKFMVAKGTKKDYTPFAVRSSIDGYSSDLMSFTVFNTLSLVSKELDLNQDFQNLTEPVTFRFYAGDVFYALFDEISLNGEMVEIVPAELTHYSFNDYSLAADAGVASGITVSDFSRTGVSRSTKSSYALTSCNNAGWTNLVIEDDKYISFTVTPDAGKQLTLTQLGFQVAKGMKKDYTPFVVRSSLDGYSSDIMNFTVFNTLSMVSQSVELSDDFLDITEPVTFRFYAGDSYYAAFDEISLTGYVE